MSALPPRARAYVALLCLSAVVASALAVASTPPWQPVLALAALNIAAMSANARTSTAVTVSLSFVVVLVAVQVLGPAGAVLVGLAGAISYFPGGMPLVKRAFNSAQLALTAGVTGLVYVGLGGPTEALSVSDFPLVLIPVSVSGALFCALNALLVSVVVALTSEQPVLDVWRGAMAGTAVAYLGNQPLALVTVALWFHVGPWSSLLLLVPLFVARSVFTQYVAEQAAYDATVRAVITAIETKDYYTRGHSERVSRATELIARERGLRSDRLAAVTLAGLMHDVGKLGVPTTVLQKQGKLDDAEFAAIKQHPAYGVDLLRDVDFLREALVAVYHHHERMDGRGYPLGLAGTQIPEFARIVMVADAFDSMTSTRSYRAARPVEAAIGELRRCAGPQFDPDVVESLVAAVERWGWEPTPEEYHGELVARDGTPLVAVREGAA